MSILEIIPLIGVGIDVLLSIASVVLPALLKQKQKKAASLSPESMQTDV